MKKTEIIDIPPLTNNQLPLTVEGQVGQIDSTTWVNLISYKQQILLDKSAKNCLIYEEDFIAFASALLACIYLGVDVVFPANGKAKTIEQLANKVDVLWVNSGKSSESLNTTSTKNSTLDLISTPKNINITLYTSGSTGEPKAIVKKLSHFINEAKALEKQWGEQAKGAIFLASVSHQHIYGMLFKFFWAMLGGHRIWQDQIAFEERLHYLLERFPKAVFISSPAFLKRIILTLNTTQASRLTCVFSSGGLLTEKQAQLAESRLATDCIRIFGSTETGGIAYQTSASQLWHCLPEVQVKVVEGVLAIRSPYCFQSSWFTTADCAEKQGDRQFLLKGRADDIVKIEEKRISLTEIENKLYAHPEVLVAKIVILEKKRTVLAAVLVLSSTGNLNYIANPVKYKAQLKHYLAQYFDDVTLPRHIRVVEKMPENQQGKILKSALIELFE